MQYRPIKNNVAEAQSFFREIVPELTQNRNAQVFVSPDLYMRTGSSTRVCEAGERALERKYFLSAGMVTEEEVSEAGLPRRNLLQQAGALKDYANHRTN
jgi:hypothetical protein